MKSPLKRVLFFIALLVLAAVPAQATIDPTTVQKLLANDSAAWGSFGYSVSLSTDGSIALIGAYGDGDESGSAYVFTRAEDGGWIQQAKLTADDGATNDWFGYSVSLSADGGMALIGAVYDDDKGDYSGSAYVFTRAADGGWIQQTKLIADDGATNDWFGYSVSLSADGSVALIGARYDDDKGDSSGSAYIFTRAADGTWIQQDKLTAGDGAAWDYFGNSVSLSADGGTALIGAHFDNDKSTDSGSAYVFTRAADGSWSQQAKLIADDGAEKDEFGWSVSLSADGSVALIGSRYDDDKGDSSGSAYIFTRAPDGTWIQQDKLIAGDGAAGGSFGHSVSLSANGTAALIGAIGDNDKGDGSGSAYVFIRAADDSWSQQAKLTPDDGATADSFGRSVFLSADGGIALIGASGDENHSGSAYVFSRSAYGWGRKPVFNTWLMLLLHTK